MRKSEIYDRCTYLVNELLITNKLHIVPPISCKPSRWFASGRKIYSGVSLSTCDGEAGPISTAWAIVFVEPDKPQMCSKIYHSFYGESVVLEKLLAELTALKGV